MKLMLLQDTREGAEAKQIVQGWFDHGRPQVAWFETRECHKLKETVIGYLSHVSVTSNSLAKSGALL